MKRFLTVILVLAVLFVGVGFWQGWFTANTSKAGEKAGFSITFNKEKLKGDWSKATDKVKSLAKAAADKVKGLIKKDNGNSTLEGKVVSVDAENKTVTVQADGKDIELPMLATEALTLDSLVGKTVKLDLEEKDGGYVIREISEAK
ncbi:MAG: hypothetical protein KDC95_23235 [Planctomycetes bacterium]|nr:hypothetical protein [Planctomycetota bacterium]